MNFFLKAICNALILIVVIMLINVDSVYSNEFTDGPRARNELVMKVNTLFETARFAELEKMAQDYRKSKSRFTDGVWKLQIYYTAFNIPVNIPENKFKLYISLAEQWCRIFPGSVTAQTVLANSWAQYAWKARGGGYAHEVNDEAWPLVRERLDKAWKIINRPLPNMADCPFRHNLILVLAKARGVKKNEFETLFTNAIRQEPGFYHHYATKADYLLPKWNGEEGEWQRFVTEAANHNPMGEGATIYTRTVWSMFLEGAWNEFDNSGVSWAKMKAGFLEIDRNYPNSPWILNTMAKFACRANDRETLKSLFGRINKNNYYNEAWGSDNVNACRQWIGLPPLTEY